MYTHDEQTIVAQCTPKGSGALAIIRISGIAAIACAERISKLAGKKSFSELSSHTIHYGWVIDEDGNHLDQVLFLLMKAPATFTGQDSIEITCHNNQLLIEKIINQAVTCGARLAQEGEFTRRAYQNKKIDLTQADMTSPAVIDVTAIFGGHFNDFTADFVGEHRQFSTGECLDVRRAFNAFE